MATKTRINPSEQLWSHFKGKARGESNPSLRNTIAVQCRNLIRKEAHTLKDRCTVPYADLEQIGMIGMIKAIERFDPTKGVAFTSFAIPYIRGEILHHLRDSGSTVKIPRRLREVYGKSNSIALRHFLQTGTSLTAAEVAEKAGCTVEKLYFAREAISNQMALPIKDEVCESLPAPTVTAVEDSDRQQHLELAWGQLRRKFSKLTSPDQELMESVYFQQLSQKTVSRSYPNASKQVHGILKQISS